MPKITTAARPSSRPNGAPKHPRPFPLTTGLLVFCLVDLVMFGLAAVMFLGGEGQTGTAPLIAQVISISLGVFGVVVAAEIVRARNGRRSARKTLTYVAAALIALAVLRRLAAFIALAVLAGVGAALIWAPASSAYFQLTEPKRQRLRNLQRAGGKAVQNFRENQGKR